MTGPFGHNSCWYWFYAAGALLAGMLVAMFLIAMHPSRRRSTDTPNERR